MERTLFSQLYVYINTKKVFVYLYMYESIDKAEKLIIYSIFENKMEKQVIAKYLY